MSVGTSKALYNFLVDHHYPTEFKRGDIGIFQLDRDTPCFAEVLSYHQTNDYPTIDIQVLIPISHRTVLITTSGIEEKLIWTLQPRQLQQVQISYPDVEYSKIPVPLATPQQGDGFQQTLTDNWIPTSTNRRPRVQGVNTNQQGRFFPTSLYNFQLRLYRYEYKDQLTQQVLKSVEKLLPNSQYHYPSYAQCFQDYFDAKYANPTKFVGFGERLNQDNQWDAVEIIISYKEDTKATQDTLVDFYFGETPQTSTLPENLTEIPENSRIFRTGKWWMNERMAEVMSYLTSRPDLKIQDIA